ncbi:peptidoglycan synthetase [Sphingobacteriaceae bacterium WQ 2009]|uniref:Peptidoglycan synthetase n=1 Tax=Rhinopithecimicrobium faecis TaxID=2820698 RepID=A0A8T4HBS0_9SPHI|nr:peptidoglycan synthetase [Sphingobacteriaceae bacterium WQ 2009]
MRIHFIAIGGSIMHNLAISLAKQGHIVSGSDDQIFEPSKTHLIEAGLMPDTLGWIPERITEDIDVVILGMHAHADNAELIRAQELNLKISSFPELIAELSEDKTRVVIAGSYGKTTITSMIMHVLTSLKKPFDYLIGSQIEGFDGLVRITKDNPLIIIEGDEYFASSMDKRSKFHFYEPNIALISGIEWDHFSSFISLEDYSEQFKRFVDTITTKGTLIYNKDDKGLQKVLTETKACKINRHGYTLPEYTINKGITYLHTSVGDIELQIFGKHNLSNIAGAYTVCEWLGVGKSEFYEAIKSFKGATRYLEFVASQAGSIVYQGFAHSPSKLQASIHAIKEQFPNQDLVTILELNAYDSLDDTYLKSYQNSMSEVTYPLVFINKDSLKEKNKNFDDLALNIRKVFNHSNLSVVWTLNDLQLFLENFKSKGNNLLLTSSNNYGGVNLVGLADKFFKNE